MKFALLGAFGLMLMFVSTKSEASNYDTIQGLVFISSYHENCEPMSQRGQILFGQMYVQAGGDAILYTPAMIEAATLVSDAISAQGNYATCMILRDMMIQYGLYNELF